MKKLNKIVSLLLAAVLTVTLIPLESVSAEDSVIAADASRAEDSVVNSDSVITKKLDSSSVDVNNTDSNIENLPYDDAGHLLSGRDIDYTPHALHDAENILEGEEDNLPAYYSVSENGFVSSVRDQRQFGTCWAMSAIACAESAAAMLGVESKDTINYSEAHLVNYQYFNDIPGPDGGLDGDVAYTGNENVTAFQNGGNNYMSSMKLMGWIGAADEKTDPSLEFPTVPAGQDESEWADAYVPSIDDSLAYSDAIHLENVYYLAAPNASFLYEDSSTDEAKSEYNLAIEDIKRKVEKYKGVSFLYQYSSYLDSHYNKESDVTCYYYPQELTDDKLKNFNNSDYQYEEGDTLSSGGHVVTIVGWDDNFDRNEFKKTWGNANGKYAVYRGSERKILKVDEPLLPKNNGAWLVKNSWGENYGEGGFFWLSYENAATACFVAYDYGYADNYDHNYQYDGNIALAYQVLNSNDKVANVFTIGNKEDSVAQRLDAVAALVYNSDATVDVKVYANPSDSNLESGELISQKEFKTKSDGYYTIELDKKPIITPGTKIAIVISGEGYDGEELYVGLDRDCDYGWISGKSSSNYGESYYCGGKSDGKWVDLKDYLLSDNISNANNRIKAYTTDVTDIKDEVFDIKINYAKNKNAYTFTGKAIKPDLSVSILGENLTEGEDYIVTCTNNVNVGKGTAVITGIGTYSGTKEVEFNIEKKQVKASDFKISLRVGALGNSAKIYAYYKDELIDNDCYEIVSIKEGSKDATATPVSLSDLVKGKKYCVTLKLSNFKLNAADTKNLLVQGCECVYETEVFTVNVLEDTKYVSENCIYNGKSWKPSVEVSYVDGTEKVIVPKSKYKVTYYNNTNAGNALIVVRGKGNYKNFVGFTNFVIKKKVIGVSENSITIALPKTALKYNGKNQLPKASVYYKENNKKHTLKLNKDYRISYKNCKNAGENTAQVLVKLSDNYDVIENGNSDNKVVRNYSIEKAKISSVKLTGKYYNDEASLNTYRNGSVDAVVKAGKVVLSRNDYTVTVDQVYKDSKGVNTKMKLTITARDNTNFTGTKIVTCVLKKK